MVTSVQTLGSVVSRAQDGFTALEKESHGSIAALEAFVEDQKQQTAELDQLVGAFQENTRQPLQELRADLSQATLAEYIPTGQTPQKRDWEYPTQLPRTENHESLIARLRGLPDPTFIARTPSSARTPARSPRKQASPRKGPKSPSKIPSPSKTKVFTDIELPASTSAHTDTQTSLISIPLNDTKSGLKEIDINVANSNRASATSASATSSNSDERARAAGLQQERGRWKPPGRH